MTPKQAQWWFPIALFFILAAAIGGFLLASNLAGGPPVEIIMPTPTPTSTKQAQIIGAVASPGIYDVRDTDRLEDLVKAAGGATSQADPNLIKLTIPRVNESSTSQKVNINTSETWLLEALPGIGETLAKAIVNYRKQNGSFRFNQDVTKVPGITRRIYERIEHLITVGD